MTEFDEQLIKDEVTRLAAGEILTRDKRIVELEEEVKRLNATVDFYEGEEERFQEVQARFYSNKDILENSLKNFLEFAETARPRFFKRMKYITILYKLEQRYKNMMWNAPATWEDYNE